MPKKPDLIEEVLESYGGLPGCIFEVERLSCPGKSEIRKTSQRSLFWQPPCVSEPGPDPQWGQREDRGPEGEMCDGTLARWQRNWGYSGES